MTQFNRPLPRSSTPNCYWPGLCRRPPRRTASLFGGRARHSVRAVVVNQNAFVATGGGQRTDRPTIVRVVGVFRGSHLTANHAKYANGNPQRRSHINFAKSVVNHAGHRPAGGGNVENRLPPVGARFAIHDAALEHHAEVLAEIHHGATGHIRALGDAHLAAIRQHLNNRPTELAAQGEHRRHRIKLRQTGNGIHGRIFGCFWTGIAHFPAICRNSPRRQANCAKKRFRIVRRMTRCAKKLFRNTRRMTRCAKKMFIIGHRKNDYTKDWFRIASGIGNYAKDMFRISHRQRHFFGGNSQAARFTGGGSWP